VTTNPRRPGILPDRRSPL